MRRFDLLAKLAFLNRYAPGAISPGPVTAAVNTEQLTQGIHRVTLLKSANYRELFNESDIKSAVA